MNHDEQAKAEHAVTLHLIRLIQDSPDVRYYVGGAHTQMRELLVAAIVANGYQGDPLEVLRPAPHHADEEPRVKRVERELRRLENGLETVRAALAEGEYARAARLVEDLQAGEVV